MGEGGEDASHLLAIYEIAQTSGIGICVDVEASYFLKSAEACCTESHLILEGGACSVLRTCWRIEGRFVGGRIWLVGLVYRFGSRNGFSVQAAAIERPFSRRLRRVRKAPLP